MVGSKRNRGGPARLRILVTLALNERSISSERVFASPFRTAESSCSNKSMGNLRLNIFVVGTAAFGRPARFGITAQARLAARL